MRKITSKHNEEKRGRRNKILLGIFLIFIMFFSVIEYSFLSFNSNGDNQNTAIATEKYNGFEFSKQSNFWILNKDGKSFIFSYNPNEIEIQNLDVKDLESYKNKTLYLKSDDVLSESEIRVNLAQIANKVVVAEKEDCEQNTIIIKEGKENKISQDNNCVFIEGGKSDLVKLADLFLFKVLGIIN